MKISKNNILPMSANKRKVVVSHQEVLWHDKDILHPNKADAIPITRVVM